MVNPPFAFNNGYPFASVCVTHQGVGSPSTVVQPVQMLPMKIKGKLHSALGSGPIVVRQVEVLEEIPEVIVNERWRNNGKSKQ